MRRPIFNIDDNIDEKSCLEMYDGSYDFYIAVLDSFVKHGEDEIKKLKDYMQNGAREEYRIIVHGLKSSAGSVGDVNLQNYAAMIDSACKKGDWERAEECHLKLVSDYEKLVELIKNRLETNG